MQRWSSAALSLRQYLHDRGKTRHTAAVYGSILLLGQGVAENGTEAQRWLEQAVGADKMDAKSLLGMALATGKAGIKRDIRRAIELLTECAANEDAKAVQMLEMIRTGKGMFKGAGRRTGQPVRRRRAAVALADGLA